MLTRPSHKYLMMEQKKITSQEAECNASVFSPFSIFRCRECFEFSLKTLKLNKVSNVKMSAENG